MHIREPFVGDIEELTRENANFRKVLFTTPHSQLVVMNLLPNEDIGMEVHMVDQFFRFEKGVGKAVLNGIEHEIKDGTAIIVPAGTQHNIINTSDSESLKLYTLYTPPNHKDGVIHRMKADALLDKEDAGSLYNSFSGFRQLGKLPVWISKKLRIEKHIQKLNQKYNPLRRKKK